MSYENDVMLIDTLLPQTDTKCNCEINVGKINICKSDPPDVQGQGRIKPRT